MLQIAFLYYCNRSNWHDKRNVSPSFFRTLSSAISFLMPETDDLIGRKYILYRVFERRKLAFNIYDHCYNKRENRIFGIYNLSERAVVRIFSRTFKRLNAFKIYFWFHSFSLFLYSTNQSL